MRRAESVMLCVVSRFSLTSLAVPIVQAPMGGGPSTPALAAAVAEAGGLGLLAAGYKTADAVPADIAAPREPSRRPFGVNVFAPPPPPGDGAAIERFAATLAGEAERYGAPLGEPRHDDDAWAAKLALVAELGVPVVSFSFGCPAAGDVEDLHRAGAAVWVTVTTAAEARTAADAGADALVVQGTEAGGHRASFDDAAPGDIGLLALLQLVAAAVDLPLVATGGIMTRPALAAVLGAGAAPAAPGTPVLLCPHAAPPPPHRAARPARGGTG